MLTFMMIIPEIFSPVDSIFVSQNTSEKSHISIDSVFTLKLIFGFFVILLVFLLSSSISQFIFKEQSYSFQIIIFAISGSFLTAATLLVILFQSKEEYGKFAFVNTAFNLIILILVAYTVFVSNKELSINEIAKIYLAASSLVMVISVIYVKRANGLCIDLINAFKLLIKTWPLIIASIFRLISNRIDLFLIGVLLSLNEVAFYSAASKISSISMLFIGNILSISLVRSQKASADIRSLKKYTIENIYIGIFILIVTILMICFSKQLLILTSGYKYLSANNIAKILLVQAFISGITAPFLALLYNLRKVKILTILELSRFIFTLFFVFTFIKLFNIEGAALGLLLSFCLNLIVITAVYAHIKSSLPINNLMVATPQ